MFLQKPPASQNFVSFTGLSITKKMSQAGKYKGLSRLLAKSPIYHSPHLCASLRPNLLTLSLKFMLVFTCNSRVNEIRPLASTDTVAFGYPF